MGRCNHPEEFSFSLIETNLTVPRADYPHSFIDSGCEYMIDFRIGRYCIATEYKVPDFCLGNEPQAEISGVIEETTGIYKILWDPKVFERNKTYSNYSIIDISYRLEDVPYETFNNEMLLENQYHLNYSILDLSRIPKGQNYRLIATFVDDEECSNVSFIEFRVPDDNATILTIIATLTVILVFISVICLYVPTIRAKVVFWFKLVSGVAIKVPTQSTDMKTFGINRREEFSPIYFAFEFPRSRLEIESQKFPPMEGNFGIVYFGRVFALNKTKGFTRVAIKTVRDNAPNEHVEALNEELCTLKKIRSHGNHENVVRMLGCCSLQKPLLIILEYVACGDLKNYLVDLRKEWSNRKSQTRFIFPSNGYGPEINRSISETSSNCIPSPTETESTILSDDADESLLSISITPKKVTPALSNVELQNFALQIAKGMAFLESISVVHRDLAARNVLINEMKILKISDFGMSRVGNYVHRNNGQQPLRWMAPESIEQFLCTSKSDVWSFGIVLWEIGTLGAFPYDSIPNDCILEYLLQSVKKGIRLMRPEICTDELYSLMLKCWSENPDERPSFKEIEEHLSGEKKKIYLDFQKLNPAYVFPPTKQT
ncbi:hypothetical protein HHI36_006957 [Cryptolaemus montrouzieri]|uniref:Protein kinase domain-containing protein n=1 Tax=Cryptolaemus montrouzieri TaxID=559131 RepID=A0ABD2MNA5_9CUCU